MHALTFQHIWDKTDTFALSPVSHAASEQPLGDQLYSTALPDVAQNRQHPNPTYRVKNRQEILMKMAARTQVYCNLKALLFFCHLSFWPKLEREGKRSSCNKKNSHRNYQDQIRLA